MVPFRPLCPVSPVAPAKAGFRLARALILINPTKGCSRHFLLVDYTSKALTSSACKAALSCGSCMDIHS